MQCGNWKRGKILCIYLCVIKRIIFAGVRTLIQSWYFMLATVDIFRIIWYLSHSQRRRQTSSESIRPFSRKLSPINISSKMQKVFKETLIRFAMDSRLLSAADGWINIAKSHTSFERWNECLAASSSLKFIHHWNAAAAHHHKTHKRMQINFTFSQYKSNNSSCSTTARERKRSSVVCRLSSECTRSLARFFAILKPKKIFFTFLRWLLLLSRTTSIRLSRVDRRHRCHVVAVECSTKHIQQEIENVQY